MYRSYEDPAIGKLSFARRMHSNCAISIIYCRQRSIFDVWARRSLSATWTFVPHYRTCVVASQQCAYFCCSMVRSSIVATPPLIFVRSDVCTMLTLICQLPRGISLCLPAFRSFSALHLALTVHVRCLVYCNLHFLTSRTGSNLKKVDSSVSVRNFDIGLCAFCFISAVWMTSAFFGSPSTKLDEFIVCVRQVVYFIHRVVIGSNLKTCIFKIRSKE